MTRERFCPALRKGFETNAAHLFRVWDLVPSHAVHTRACNHVLRTTVGTAIHKVNDFAVTIWHSSFLHMSFSGTTRTGPTIG